MYARSIYALSHYHCQEAIHNVETLPVLVLYIIQKCCYCRSNPLSMVYWALYPWYVKLPIHGISHGIVICYTWYLKPSLHGILNPLLMAYRTPYQKYCDPPSMVYQMPMAFWPSIHVILTPYPYYIDPLPMVCWTPTHSISNLLSMVLWTSYTCYIVPIPMIFWLRYTWNIENPFMVLWTPSFDRNEGVQLYHGAVQYTMTKIGLWGQNTIWYLKLLLPRWCRLKWEINEKSSYKLRWIFFRHWYTFRLIYKCHWRETCDFYGELSS